MKYKKLNFSVDPTSTHFPLFQNLLKVIPQIPGLDDLIDRATLKGEITVKFVNKGEIPTEGRWSSGPRVISILKGMSVFETVETLIWEIHNAANAHGDAIQARDYANRDLYAIAIETSEYLHTYVPTHQMMEVLINNSALLSVLNSAGIVFDTKEMTRYLRAKHKDFQGYWNSVSTLKFGRATTHAENYRLEYDRNMQRRERKQPEVAVTRWGRDQRKAETATAGSAPVAPKVATVPVAAPATAPTLVAANDEATQVPRTYRQMIQLQQHAYMPVTAHASASIPELVQVTPKVQQHAYMPVAAPVAVAASVPKPSPAVPAPLKEQTTSAQSYQPVFQPAFQQHVETMPEQHRKDRRWYRERKEGERKEGERKQGERKEGHPHQQIHGRHWHKKEDGEKTQNRRPVQ
ncbi:MAG: hypothetical protein ACHQJ6_08485 [Candidatus Berkiellales bacterium]